MITLFTASLGEFDFEPFKETPYQLSGYAGLITFLGVSTVLLLNLLIAILSHTYEETQVKAKDEYNLGMAKNYYKFRWAHKEVFQSGIPLPAALNAIRIVTRPVAWMGCIEIEKVLNLAFLVCVTYTFMSVFLLGYVLLFVVIGCLTTTVAGFLVLLNFVRGMFSDAARRRRKGRLRGKAKALLTRGTKNADMLHANRRTDSIAPPKFNRVTKVIGFAFALFRILVWLLFLPLYLTGIWAYIILIKYPYFVVVGGYKTVKENSVLMMAIMRDAKENLQQKNETRPEGFGR